ncbi:hypothetical protein Tco_0763918, partial [Tanacetum coccineum]
MPPRPPSSSHHPNETNINNITTIFVAAPPSTAAITPVIISPRHHPHHLHHLTSSPPPTAAAIITLSTTTATTAINLTLSPLPAVTFFHRVFGSAFKQNLGAFGYAFNGQIGRLDLMLTASGAVWQQYDDVTPSDTYSVQAPSGGVTDWYQSQGYRKPGRIS